MAKSHHDIKAPDGYVLGGLRKVRTDGTILFQRGWWQAPKDWAGQKVWVHEGDGVLDAAPAGIHIHAARQDRKSVECRRTERPDAKHCYRNPAIKAFVERQNFSAANSSAAVEICQLTRCKRLGYCGFNECVMYASDCANVPV